MQTLKHTINYSHVLLFHIFTVDPFSMLNIDLDASSTSLTTGAYYSSFPVDVVVFIRVEPSIIRFNCVPVSRVECLLQVPSLDVVFSTRGPDMEAQIGEASPPLKTKGIMNLWV